MDSTARECVCIMLICYVSAHLVERVHSPCAETKLLKLFSFYLLYKHMEYVGLKYGRKTDWSRLTENIGSKLYSVSNPVFTYIKI